MIKPTRNSVATRPVKSAPAFQLSPAPLSLVEHDTDGTVVMELSAVVNVPAAIAGGMTNCTLAFYDDIKRSDNPPAHVVKVDFSAFIDNDSLKKSTLLHGVISNQQTSIVRRTGSQATTPGYVALTASPGFLVRAGSTAQQSREISVGTSRTRPIDRFIELGRPPFLDAFIPKDVATRSPRYDGVVMERSNPADIDNQFSLRPTDALPTDDSNLDTVQLQRDYRVARCRATVRVPAAVLQAKKTVLMVPGSPDMSELARPTRIESVLLLELEPGGSNLRPANGLRPPSVVVLGVDSDASTVKVQVSNPNGSRVTVKASRFGLPVSGRRVRHAALPGLQLEPRSSDVVSVDISSLRAVFLCFNCATGQSASLSTVVAVPPLERKGRNRQVANRGLQGASARVLARNDSQRRSIEVLALIDAPRRPEDVTLKRRVRSLSGAILGGFEPIPNATVIRSGASISATDTSLRHDYFYEYAAFSLLEGRQIGMSSFVLFRDPLFFASEVGVMSVRPSTGSASGDVFEVGVKFSALRVEDTLTSLLNATDGSIPTSNGNVQIGNYVENIKNNREKLADLYRVSVVRQDLDTGREYDLGTFPAGRIEITPQLLESRSVPPRAAQSNYVFRLLQRNAITLFNEIEEVIKDPETLADFRVRVSKFLGPLNLVSSVLPSSLRLREKNPLRASKFFPADDFLEGFTGVTRTLTAGTNTDSGAGGAASFAFRTDPFGERSFVTLDVTPGQNTIGFILGCSLGGASIPLGFFPADRALQREVEDDVTGRLVGPRRYTVSFVSDQLEIGAPIESATVIGRGYNG